MLTISVNDPTVSEHCTLTTHRPLRPPLKWAGGKRWLVPHLLPYWKAHSHRRLIEPFCGGLAVTLGLSPQSALLNDRNPHLISFYCWLKKGLLVSEISSETDQNAIPLKMENDEKMFYTHRRRFNHLLGNGGADTAEAAALFYYLNRTGFNGLCRFNRSGEFNVPFGDYNRINYNRDFRAYSKAFERWDFTSGDFEMAKLKATDFVYADPPYDVEFTHYSKEGFGWDEQVRTAKWLVRHKGPVILSNQATDRIVELYQKLGFKLQFLDAPRRISCTGDRTPAREVLAFWNLE
jgi:DNA adenine methylase